MTKVRLSLIVKALIAIILVVFVIVDLIYDRSLMDQSAAFSLDAQQWGGKPLSTIGDLLSTIFTYWILVYLHFYIVFGQEHEYVVYSIFSYFLPLVVVIVLKAIYYRGRPYVVAEKVAGCECDPGMPSGHACMAVMCYSLAYDQIKRSLINGIENKIKRRLIAFCFGSLCTIMAGLVMMSRITLGVHSYPQILIGATIAIFCNLVFTYDIFKKVLSVLLPARKLAAFISGSILIAIAIMMMLINHLVRENPNYWKYFWKCPSCLGSFVRGQSESFGLIFFPAAYLISSAIADPIKKQSGSIVPDPNSEINPIVNQQPSQLANQEGTKISTNYRQEMRPETSNSERAMCTKRNWIKYGVMLALAIPALVVFLIHTFAVKPAISGSGSVIGQSFEVFSFYGLASALLAISMSGGKVIVFRKLGLLDDSDLINPENLRRETVVPAAEAEDMVKLPTPEQVDPAPNDIDELSRPVPPYNR